MAEYYSICKSELKLGEFGICKNFQVSKLSNKDILL
jgi:hypothetical protein